MTVCNMSIEAGARAGMIAPDETTFEYLRGRDHAPTGADWDAAVAAWSHLRTDDDAEFDDRGRPRRRHAHPVRHLGHQPRPGRAARHRGARPRADARRERQGHARRALEYMGLQPGTPLREMHVDTVFVGSCTNGRIEDLRAAAAVIARPAGRRRRADARRARLRAGAPPGRAGGPGRGLHRGRRRVAPGRLLDVPGHEPRPARPGRAQRVDVEPQLRGSAGQGRPHPPGVARWSPPRPPCAAPCPAPPISSPSSEGSL